MRNYFRFCRYIKEYYARTEGEGSGEGFGAFLVSTIVLALNVFTVLGGIDMLFSKSLEHESSNIVPIVIVLITALLNYLVTFKNNKYLEYTEGEKKMNGTRVLVYIFTSIFFMIIIIVIHREFFLVR